MKTEQIAALLMDGVKSVEVQISRKDNSTYTYKTTLILEEGDWILVPVADTFKLAKVAMVHTNLRTDHFDTKWIIQKVDFTHFNQMKMEENDITNYLLVLEQKTVRANALQAIANESGMSVAQLQSDIKSITKD